MAPCSNCGHDNPDWVPVEDFIRVRESVAAIKHVLVEMGALYHRVLDLAGLDVPPPPPGGDVRPFKRRGRDRGQHRGGYKQ